MIWFGFGVGCISLVIIYGVVRFGLLKIPLRPFFIITSALMFLLAVTFTGSGVSELQEAGVIGQTFFETSWFPDIDWLGLYPTWETCGSQIILLILGAGLLFRRQLKERRETA